MPLSDYGLSDLESAYSHRYVPVLLSGLDGEPPREVGISLHVFDAAPMENGWARAGRRDAPEVLLLHGYLDHALVNAKTVRLLCRAGYRVLAPDLPGHGHSGGETTEIGDFADYSGVLRRVLEETNGRMVHAVGHSAGTAALLTYVNHHGNSFAKIVFVAPLIRTVGWWPIKLGLPLLRIFTSRVFRRPGACSSDPEFVAEHEADPLAPKTASLDWSKAMLSWEKRLRDYGRLPHRLTIIQGTKDTVVAWKHNLRFFRRRVPEASIHLVRDGMHCLLNERAEIRRIVEELLLDALI